MHDWYCMKGNKLSVGLEARVCERKETEAEQRQTNESAASILSAVN